MTNLLVEFLISYTKSGIIAYAVFLLTLIGRLTYVAFKQCGVMFATRGLQTFANDVDKHDKCSKSELIVRLVIWPYGIIRATNVYFKEENKWIKRMRK